jgi:hypothetical protein
MHRRMLVQYGNSVMSQQSVCECIERFKNVHTSIKHEEGYGPATEGNGACVACFSAQNFLVCGHKEDCATVDHVHQKARRLCLKMLYL